MDLLEALKEESNNTYTENEALAYKTTLNKNLDYFASISLFKYDTQLGVDKFKEAFLENPLLSMKSLFYTRNIRGLGQGLRAVTRSIYNWLAKEHTDIMRLNLELVGNFGRWDDYYAFVGTPLEEDAMNILSTQIKKDLNEEHPSICAKWLASVNASNESTRALGKLTARYFGMSEKEYRKTLSYLRKKIDVVEKKMCAKEFSLINYEAVPSYAMINYRNAFAHHDKDRFSEYLEDVKTNKKKINSSTLYPYDIMRQGKLTPFGYYCSIDTDDTLEEAWKNLANYVEGETSTLVVADTSASMYGEPLNVAISLALYFASRNKGIWKDKLITFSSVPSFVELDGCKTLAEMVRRIPAILDNTNVEAVFDLILYAALKHNVAPSDMVETIIIVSDMQFDRANNHADNKYSDIIKNKYLNAGYKVPNLVFWNVNEKYNLLFHSKYNEAGVKLVSGFSPSLFKEVVTNIEANPYETMISILNNELFDCVKVK